MEAIEDGGVGSARDTVVAFVCTANRARSPFAAAALARRLGGLPVVVTSYGIREQRGAPALPQAVRTARSFGIDLGPHRARTLQPGELATADLVVGFEYAHVAGAVVVGGAERARTFLLPELADALLRSDIQLADGVGGFARAVRDADECRRRFTTLSSGVPDPAGGSERTFMATYGEIDRLAEVICSRLFGVGADGG